MSEPSSAVSGLQRAINRAALVVAFAILAAIVFVWWQDRTRTWETPRWDAARFVALRAPAPAPAGRVTWRLAYNPDCSHCRARLAELMRRPRDPAHDPALGVLLVDVRARPDSLEISPRVDGGVDWDSAGVWRERWGHRLYGEVLVFAPDGALLRTAGPEADPAAADSR